MRTRRQAGKNVGILILLTMVISQAILACDILIPATPTPLPTTTPVPRPSATPTPGPLGSNSNPIVFGIITDNPNSNQAAAAAQLAKQLEELIGQKIVSKAALNYPVLLNSMAEGNVHIAMLPPLTYLYANQKGYANSVLLANHFGVYQYGTQYLAHIDSGFKIYFDPAQNQSIANAEAVLPQFRNKRPCWVEPQSPSGYILPVGLFAELKVPALEGIFVQSHVAVVRTLYAKNVCDFGVTFTDLGDPRTAAADLPEIMNKVVIIWRSDPSIPNLNVSLHPSLGGDLSKKITDAFVEIAKNRQVKNLLTNINNYDIQDLKSFPDSVYNPLRKAVDLAKMDLETMIGK